jgi:hypothetical protein
MFPDIANRDWLCRQADLLLQRCPFVPSGEPFVLSADKFDSLPIVQDRVQFLVKRFRLPFNSIAVYLHQDMKEPGKVLLTGKFDTTKIKLGHGHELSSVEPDGTYTIRDKFHPDGPKRFKINERLPVLYTVSMYLNQTFLAKELMGAVVAHEMAHLYLDTHRIQSLKATHTIEMERTTDVAAFVMGLGEIYLRGCETERHTWQNGQRYIQTRKLGYLSPDEMSFVHMYILDRVTN